MKQRAVYRTILVPLDGSKLAEWALPAALNIARRSQASIELVTVDIVVPTLSVGLSTHSAEPPTASAPAAYLAQVAQRLAALYPGPIKHKVITGHIRAADGLLRQARRIGADLIVMATHGRGPFKRMWLGSTADAVARRSRIPTLLIHPAEEGSADLEREQVFHRILIPLDGSAAAESILPHSLALGDTARAHYTLYQAVLPALGFAVDPLPAGGLLGAGVLQLNEEKRRHLEHTAEPLRQHGLRVQTSTEIELSAADGILKCADSWPADLITLTTHGHGGALRLLLGSVADKVVRAARVPVLLYRPPAR